MKSSKKACERYRNFSEEGKDKRRKRAQEENLDKEEKEKKV